MVAVNPRMFNFYHITWYFQLDRNTFFSNHYLIDTLHVKNSLIDGHTD